ncbi:4-hydroxythreonine-4-phosphate dehydrogenase PdxA [Sphingomonas sp. HHU CXW]|uniref:4-hydroxythreonine-4-phosphate dehydrogenase n=1 Tax=Sphingomonas hominis TaxID=2741495 RepID=A0ABX2JFL6_9SPHN|nr:4-hydroxythreonine-4-phosphate dehydrogenase PdxA [Sphingomonas hominis]NTS64524.1 4-hydroxythreonine-4-phosphate dehydrogenase PdxA [Sphingomonas hominis]
MTPIVVSMGDPAGIGPEIIAKAWAARVEHDLPPFVVIGDLRAFAAVWQGPIVEATTLGHVPATFGDALPVMAVDAGGTVVPGRPDMEGARSALEALETATVLARSGAARALVTAPVGKAQLYQVGFTPPGQTEFVADRCGVSRDDAVMMLAGPSLRVVPITTHVPLAEVPRLLTVDLIVAKARVTARELRDSFGIAHPRLAFAGINPHAGEGGALGREEIDVIEPAIEQLRAEGIETTGPVAADTMFHPRARERYDAAMCAYHDQALVPLKTLHFDEGVNVTLGLPIVRTSPDHGTAFGIAGQDQAHPGAMIAAIRMADTLACNRQQRAAARP